MIFTWLLYPILEAFVQAWLFKHKRGYGHTPGDQFYLVLFIVRGMACIAWGILIDTQVGYFIPLVFWCAGTHWLIFDPLLNKLRGFDWNYEGKHSGWLKDVPASIQVIVACVISIISFIYLIKMI